jgi:hypothetical protein
MPQVSVIVVQVMGQLQRSILGKLCKHSFSVLFQGAEQDLAKHLIILVYGTAFNRLEQQSSKELRTSILESLKYSIIPTLSSTLRINQDTSKFIAVDILHRIFNECPTNIVKELEKEEKQRFDIWIESIRSGVRQILTSKTSRYLYFENAEGVGLCQAYELMFVLFPFEQFPIEEIRHSR